MIDRIEEDWREMERENAIFSREYSDELLHYTLRQIEVWEAFLLTVEDPMAPFND